MDVSRETLQEDCQCAEGKDKIDKELNFTPLFQWCSFLLIFQNKPPKDFT